VCRDGRESGRDDGLSQRLAAGVETLFTELTVSNAARKTASYTLALASLFL